MSGNGNTAGYGCLKIYVKASRPRIRVGGLFADRAETQVAKNNHGVAKTRRHHYGRWPARPIPRHLLENTLPTSGFDCGQRSCRYSTTMILAILTTVVGGPILAQLTERERPPLPCREKRRKPEPGI